MALTLINNYNLYFLLITGCFTSKNSVIFIWEIESQLLDTGLTPNVWMVMYSIYTNIASHSV